MISRAQKKKRSQPVLGESNANRPLPVTEEALVVVKAPSQLQTPSSGDDMDLNDMKAPSSIHRSGFGFNSPKNRALSSSLPQQPNDENNEPSTQTPRSTQWRETRSTRTPSSARRPRSARKGGRGAHSSGGERKSEVEQAYNETCTVTSEEVRQVLNKRQKVDKWDQREKIKVQQGYIRDLKYQLRNVFDQRESFLDNCRQVEAGLWRQLEEGEQTVQSLREEMRQHENELTDLHRERRMLSNKLAEATGDVDVVKEREEALRRELEPLRREFAILSARHEGYEETLSKEREENVRLSADLEEALRMVEIEKRKAETLRDEIKRELETNLERTSAELASVKSELLTRERELAAALASLSEFQRASGQREDELRASKSKLEDKVTELFEKNAAITGDLIACKETAARNEGLVTSLREQLDEAQRKFQDARERFGELEEKEKEGREQLAVERELRSRAERREEEERRERTAAVSELMAIQSDCRKQMEEVQSKHREELGGLREDMNGKAQEIAQLNEELREEREHGTALKAEIGELKVSLATANENAEQVERLSHLTGEVEVLRMRLKQMEAEKAHLSVDAEEKLREMEEKVREGEEQRRRMHNIIQELRGNVRVFARVRPFLPSDGVSMDEARTPLQFSTNEELLTLARGETERERRAMSYKFNFDKVFPPSCGQEAVFDEVAEFVQSALDGFNVCLFSYGQTGSGKTHTMQGAGVGHMRGIIPRAMEKVGEYKLELEAQGWCYTMKISFVEIYNEAIRDLLNESSNAPNVEIKRDQKGVPSLSNTTFLDVDPNDRAMLENIMEVAARHRSVASTDMNAQSSRSHSIFTLYLSARNEERNSQLKGTLHLVDLAGSERLSRSGATGSRLKETQAINKSLSSLSDVFVAIGNKQSHIPFRNSKLTQVLQPCLSGDGKTLMFVNLSPTEESFDETLCSLRFAKHVNNVELGRCKKQVRDLPSSSSSSSSMREEEQDGEEEESKEERGRGAQRSMKKRPTQTASRDTSVTQKKVRRS